MKQILLNGLALLLGLVLTAGHAHAGRGGGGHSSGGGHSYGGHSYGGGHSGGYSSSRPAYSPPTYAHTSYPRATDGLPAPRPGRTSGLVKHVVKVEVRRTPRWGEGRRFSRPGVRHTLAWGYRGFRYRWWSRWHHRPFYYSPFHHAWFYWSGSRGSYLSTAYLGSDPPDAGPEPAVEGDALSDLPAESPPVDPPDVSGDPGSDD
jgi:hypothetical protein